ncbi:hypothetical protein NE237_016015 [Protea cynaroides]|uniref:DUF7903 domain-containing protein n=1 Tax=Protea cynaroides TaxID=273540 RepID=A0A9Q0QRS0_9MAGN|nr:hypothetical protein NE237_016015 [Protea cynaroides]
MGDSHNKYHYGKWPACFLTITITIITLVQYSQPSFLCKGSGVLLMAYIPPHKRHLKDSERPLPTPDLLVPQFERNFNLKPASGEKIIYATQAISRWWVVDYADDQISSLRLEPISCESFERKTGEKPLTLVSVHVPKGVNEPTTSCEKAPMGVDVDKEKEYFHVKVSDKCRPRVILTCKCSAMKGKTRTPQGKFITTFYRAVCNDMPIVRQLVVDMSCPKKDLDLRLMLAGKKILKELPEVSLKMTGINKLLRDRMVEIEPINKLLEDTLKLIWEQFLKM